MDKPLEALLGGRSLNSLAAETGIAYSTLHRKAAAPDALTVGELLRIAEALDKSPADALTEILAATKSAAA